MKTEKAIVLSVLAFSDHELRIIDHHGGRWFPAKDVCDGLGLGNSRVALRALPEREKSKVSFPNARGDQRNQQIISEQGAWRLALRSNKKEAKAFQDWLLYEVLPSIHKTGTYSVPGALPPPTPVTYLAVERMKLRIAKEERIAQDNKAKEERYRLREDRTNRVLQSQAFRRAVKMARATGRVAEDTLIAYELKAEAVLAGEPLDDLKPTPIDWTGHLSMEEMAYRCGCELHAVKNAVAHFGFRSDAHDALGRDTYAPEKVVSIESRLLHRQVGKCGVQLVPRD